MGRPAGRRHGGGLIVPFLYFLSIFAGCSYLSPPWVLHRVPEK